MAQQKAPSRPGRPRNTAPPSPPAEKPKPERTPPASSPRRWSKAQIPYLIDGVRVSRHEYVEHQKQRAREAAAEVLAERIESTDPPPPTTTEGAESPASPKE